MDMKKEETMSEMNRRHLPDVIIEEILAYIPLKSLIRCQIVSNSWFDIIERMKTRNPLFESDSTSLALFFSNYSKKQTSLILNSYIYDDDEDDEEEQTSATLLNCCRKGVERWRKLFVCRKLKARGDREWDNKLSVLPKMLNFKFPPEFQRLWLIGQCNGILCLGGFESKSIVLVNPLLKEMKTLPNNCDYDTYSVSKEVSGFGFDNMTMDFKVVTLYTLGHQSTAKVYSLRSNAWRKIFAILDFVVVDHTQGSIFLNGVVHWCARTRPFSWRILTFNMATELFQLIEFPQGWNESNLDRNIQPLVFLFNKESLVLVQFRPYGDIPNYSSEPYVIWKMNYKNGNNQVSWTKLYSLTPPHRLKNPVCFLKENKFLYETTMGELVLYDLLNHCESQLPLSAGYRSGTTYYERRLSLGVGVFRPSFVSINN